MAISAPSIREIADRVLSDIESEVGFTIPILSKAVFRILSFAIAGAWIILYKYGTDAFKQRFVQTANREFLILLGEILNVFIQPATTWSGEAEAVSTVDTGAIVVDTLLVNNNTGIVYRVTVGVNLSIGTVTFSLASTTGGSIGNLNVGDTLEFVQPLPGVESTVEISAVTVPGEDEEDLETYRQRVLDAYQKKPQGGALADYELWAEEAPNVINAYVYARVTPGGVDVYIEVDNQTDGIPTTAQLDIAEDYINYNPITGRADRRPVTAEVDMYAISRRTFEFEITALSPDTPELRDDIESALITLMEEKEPYILGLSVTRNDSISQAEATSVVQQIASEAGSTISGVLVSESSVLIDLEVLGKGEKAKTTAGDITFTV